MRKIFIIGSIFVARCLLHASSLFVYRTHTVLGADGAGLQDTLSIMLCLYDPQLSQKGFIALCTCV